MANGYASIYSGEQIDNAIGKGVGLPAPSVANEGKVLGVKDGQWALLSKTAGDAVLGPKTITENGTYDPADDGLDGYSQVTVNVSGGGGSETFSDSFEATPGLTVPASVVTFIEGITVNDAVFIEDTSTDILSRFCDTSSTGSGSSSRKNIYGTTTGTTRVLLLSYYASSNEIISANANLRGKTIRFRAMSF